METANLFAKEWETVEAQNPLPRRMRRMLIMPFEEMKQKVLVDTEIIMDKEAVQTVIAEYDDLKEFVMDPVGRVG